MQRFEKATVLYTDDPIDSKAWNDKKNNYTA